MEEEKALILQVTRMVGYTPQGLTDLLHVLAHPDAIELTQAYLDSRRPAGECDFYQHGWTCAKEAQARAEAMVRAKQDVTYILPIPWCEKCNAKYHKEKELNE